MKATLLATADVPTVRRALARFERHFPGARLIVYLRDSFRPELADELRTVEVRSDRIRGRWVKMIRALREERFDAVFVIFAGGSDHWKMKIVSFLAGGRSLFVFNESGDFFEWNRQNLATIRQHLRWRLKAPEGSASAAVLPWTQPAVGLVARVYACTVGPVLGLLYLLLHVTYLEIVRVRQSARH